MKNSQNILFRVDASLTIGTGHVMRCLNLAHELKKNGSKCTFICQVTPGNLFEKIAKEGFNTIPLKTKELDSFQWEEDAQNTILRMKEARVSWLIIDHYKIDERWHKLVAKYCKKIFVIDDLANRSHYCDVLLDSNVSRKKIDYQNLTPKRCQLLIGVKYLFLDPLCYSLSEKKRHGSICFLGGGDNQEDLKKIIPLLSSLRLPQPITCIFSAQQPNTKSLIAFCQKHHCQSLINPSNFKELCQTASFAIVRCGLVSYELAAFKTPNIAIFHKGIHEEVARWLEKKGYTFPITINNFLNRESANKAIEKALDINPMKALQAIPGTLKVAQHILKVGTL